MERALSLLLASPALNGLFVQDVMDFYKSAQYRDLCQDKMEAIWPSQSMQ